MAARSSSVGALAVVGRADLQDGAGEPQPVGAVVGRHRDDLPEQHHAAAKVVALERGVGLAAQLRQRLGDLAGVGS